MLYLIKKCGGGGELKEFYCVSIYIFNKTSMSQPCHDTIYQKKAAKYIKDSTAKEKINTQCHGTLSRINSTFMAHEWFESGFSHYYSHGCT